MYAAYALFGFSLLSVVLGLICLFKDSPDQGYTKSVNVSVLFFSAGCLSIVAAVAKYLFG